VLSPKAVYETQVKKTADIMPAGPTAYARAVELLRQGNLVALPTETVYGLAALASNDAAVRAIYDAKGRPRHNPLIVHIFDGKKANDLAVVSPFAQTLMNRFWPNQCVCERRPRYDSHTVSCWFVGGRFLQNGISRPNCYA